MEMADNVNTQPASMENLALVLSGGGARAAYQAGVLQYIAEVCPDVTFPILTGVSAGGINAAFLANNTEGVPLASAALVRYWLAVSTDKVFKAESALSLYRRVLGNTFTRRPLPDIVLRAKEGEGLLDTAPLRAFLSDHLPNHEGVLYGIGENLTQGNLKAVSVTATNYSTGQSVTWAQGLSIEGWQRVNRVGIQADLSIDHVMASTALPILFPAVQIGDFWYGDGGIRHTAPLSPAIHLGATKILAISTRYDRSRKEAEMPAVVGYPPAAQVIGILLNAIFLDVLDQDAHTLERINELVRDLGGSRSPHLRPVDFLLMRPSVDLGQLASGYEIDTPGGLRLLTRGLGTSEIKSPDWLSMLLFDKDYISTLIQIGWEDAARQREKILAFFERPSAINTEHVPERPIWPLAAQLS